MAESRIQERVTSLKTRWYFTKEELERSPSRFHGVDYDKELSYRQQTATMIQDMGHRLKLTQVCTATAIVYMHRFFIIHSFRSINRWNIASAALFLAAKVEEQPQKLEYVARVFHSFINRDNPNIDPTSEKFAKLVEDITSHELLILQTLGFDLAVLHPHPHVVKCTQLVRASKDLSQTAYFMAHNSLSLTTFCLEHRPTVVACCCINLACVWKGIEIPPSQDQKKWWEYVDSSINQELLDSLTKEFLLIYSKCPSKYQKKMNEQIKQNKLAQGENISQGLKGKSGQPNASLSTSSSSSSSSKHPSRLPPSSSHISEKPHSSAGKMHSVLSKSHPQAQPPDRPSKHPLPPVPSTSNKLHQNLVKGLSSGTGSTATLSSRAKLPLPVQLTNNKVQSRHHEGGHREISEHATQHQPQSHHSGGHKYPYPPMPGTVKERHGREIVTGNVASRGIGHGSSSQHDAAGSRTHGFNHHQQQQPMLQPAHARSSNKRLHASSTTTTSSSFSSTPSGSLEGVAKKRLKMDTQPPLPSIGYEEIPPPPPPPSQMQSYSAYHSSSSSSSLPPLPPPVVDSPPPPPPQ